MTRISEAVECLESLGYTVTPPDAAINAGIQNSKNTWSLLMDALTPKPDPRADLVDLFEARAETHDDKSWIEVEEAADLVMDREAEVVPAGEVEWEYLCRGGGFNRYVYTETEAKKWSGRGYSVSKRTKAVEAGPWVEVQR